jgi:hypothetical protein
MQFSFIFLPETVSIPKIALIPVQKKGYSSDAVNGFSREIE